MASLDSSEPTPQLRRHLGWLDAAAINVGIILGSGIFFAPAQVAQATPNLLLATGLWVVGGFLAACGSLTFAEASARVPRAGGFYAVQREAYGDHVAFISGWAALVLTYPASIAAVAIVLVDNLRVLWRGLGAPSTSAIVVILLATFLNLFGVRLSGFGQRFLTGFKLFLVAALIGVAMWFGTPPYSDTFHTPPTSMSGLFLALVSVLWTYDGWSGIGLLAGEMRDPGRDLGRAVVFSSVILALLYGAMQVATSLLFTPEMLGQSAYPLGSVLQTIWGPAAQRFVALLVVVCTFGSLHGVLLTGARIAYAMAHDKLVPPLLGRTHAASGAPVLAVIILGLSACIIVGIANFTVILELFSMSVWLFYALTAWALLILRRRQVGQPTWKAPWGSFLPGVVITFGLVLAVFSLINNPRSSILGLLVLSMGIPGYKLWRRVNA